MIRHASSHTIENPDELFETADHAADFLFNAFRVWTNDNNLDVNKFDPEVLTAAVIGNMTAVAGSIAAQGNFCQGCFAKAIEFGFGRKMQAMEAKAAAKH